MNGFGTFLALAIVITSIAGWLTHIITCIVREEWLLLIAGAVAAPVGVVHGIGIWFGVW
jgi:hypothetical protein